MAKKRRPPVPLIDFHRTKYGSELLIDVAWIRDMPSFIIGDPHALTFYDITLITRGRGSLLLDGHRHAVRPGSVFFSAPGEVRQWQSQKLDGICLFFPAMFLEEFFNDRDFVRRLPFFDRPPAHAALTLTEGRRRRLERALTTMRGEVNLRRADSIHLLRARLYETLITLAREYARAHRVSEQRPIHPIVERFMKQVDESFRRHHDVKFYARRLGLTAGHLSTLCRRYLGRSAKAVIQDRVSIEARRLLLYTDESGERIGYALGFTDPSYFTRAFRRWTGKAPGSFRSVEHVSKRERLLTSGTT